MAKIKSILFCLSVGLIAAINAQPLGFGLFGSGGLSLSGGGQASSSATLSAPDNRTVQIVRAILKTPFTKAGFFRKISLWQMLNANGGGFGFNKSFLFGPAAATTTTTTTEVPAPKTPYPDTVFRPEVRVMAEVNTDVDTEQNTDTDVDDSGAKVVVAGSVSFNEKEASTDEDSQKDEESEETPDKDSQKDEESEETPDKDSESTNTESRFSAVANGVDTQPKISVNGGGSIGQSKVNVKVNGNGGNGNGNADADQSGIFRLQGNINLNGGGNGNGDSAASNVRISTSSAVSSSANSIANGYQYFPAGPDRLTLPTTFQRSDDSKRRSVSSANNRQRSKSTANNDNGRKNNDLSIPEEINNLSSV